MKEFILEQLKKPFEQLLGITKTFNETYQAGLTDVRGPKPMKLKIFKDKMEVRYFQGLGYKGFTVYPSDIITLEMGVETMNNTGNMVAGAVGGALLGGVFGAVAGVAHHAKHNKQDCLNLVIRYKGEERPLVLVNSRNTQKIYQMLKQMR